MKLLFKPLPGWIARVVIVALISSAVVILLIYVVIPLFVALEDILNPP